MKALGVQQVSNLILHIREYERSWSKNVIFDILSKHYLL